LRFFNSGPQTDKLARASQAAYLRDFYRTLLDTPRNSDPSRLLKFGYRVYSQADEDGILREIFRRIGEGNRTFIELGTGSGLENNTLFLITQGWSGVWIEGSARKVSSAKKTFASFLAQDQLRIAQHFITAVSIDRTIASLHPKSELDLMSIDLDGNDYYILDAIRSVSPRVIVAEYNAKFPPDVFWVMQYNESHQWDSSDYFGASLRALEDLLAPRGYALVGCSVLGTNAFFVRTDLIAPPAFCQPFTSENHYEPPRYFLHPVFESGFPVGFGPFRKQGKP
jgi:hypothetical protein